MAVFPLSIGDDYGPGINKFVLWITAHAGTIGFFVIIFSWIDIWLCWYTLAPAAWSFDPFPAFEFCLFLSNMIQIFLMPLIMIGQNMQSNHGEASATRTLK